MTNQRELFISHRSVDAFSPLSWAFSISQASAGWTERCVSVCVCLMRWAWRTWYILSHASLQRINRQASNSIYANTPVGTGFVQATGKFNHCLKDRNGWNETLLWFHFRVNRCFSRLQMRKERESARWHFSICPTHISDSLSRNKLVTGWI